MGLGKNLKEILKQKNMTIKDLSEKTGISANTLYSITKRDGKTARFDIVDKIITALDIPPNLLLDEEDISTEFVIDGMTSIFIDRINSALNSEHVSHLAELSKACQSDKDSLTLFWSLIHHFNNLNATGKIKAIQLLDILYRVPEYQSDDFKQSLENGEIFFTSKKRDDKQE